MSDDHASFYAGVFTSGRLIVAITHYDNHLKLRRRAIPEEKQKQQILDGIRAAVGVDFPQERIICVSGYMALCAHQLGKLHDEDIIREAEDYLRCCPMGQGFNKINEENIPVVAKHLLKHSGLTQLEEW